jgi:diguanylate cyclase (GGDEF)-like protein/PAS domain S-box-containing protein
MSSINLGPALRTQISLASAAIAVLLSVAVSYFAAETSKLQIEEREGEAFATRAKNILDVMDRGMFERIREIRNAANLDEIRDPAISVVRKRELLERLQQNFNAYAWIGICDTQGRGVIGTGGYLEGKDLSQRPWCTQGRKGDFIGDVHDALLLAKLLPNMGGQNFYLVDVAAPIRDGRGNLQGVLCGHIYWHWAEEMLDSRRAPAHEILLLSKDGMVLSGPEQARSDLSKLAPQTMRAIASSEKDSGYLLETWSDGHTYLVGYAKSSGYRDYPGLGWTTLVREDASLAFAPAAQLSQRILLVGTLLGLVFAALGWLFADRIARPLVRLTEAASRIAAGEYKYSVPEYHGKSEVAQLYRAFKDMVTNLMNAISRQTEAEEKLRLSAKVFANNTEAVMITDADHKIVMVNHAFTEITGYSEDEVRGRNPRLLSSGRQAPEFYQMFYAEIEQRGVWRGEIWNKRRNGEIFPLWCVVSVLRDEHNKVSHCIAIYTDITERKENEQLLNAAKNALAKSNVMLERKVVERTGELEKLNDKLRHLLDEQSSLLDNQTVGMLTLQNRKLLWCNPAFVTMMGYDSLGEMLGMSTRQFYAHEADFIAVGQAYQGLGDAAVLRRDFEFVRKDGKHLWVDLNGTDLPGGYGQSLWVIVDVTARVAAEESVRRSENKFRALYDSTSEAVMLLDQNAIIDCNNAMLSMFGLPGKANACQLTLADLSPPLQPEGRSSAEMMTENLTRSLEAGNFRFDWTHQRVDNGQSFPTEVRMTAIELEGRWIVLAVVWDISERVAMMQRIEKQANFDYLTSMCNRRHFMELAERELERARRYRTPLAALAVDIDFFKKINDTYGHAAGDQALIEFSRLCLEMVRQTDVAGRLGGEEFAILLPGADAERAMEIAERFRERWAQCVVKVTGQEVTFSFTVSVGVALLNAGHARIDQLLHSADLALYQAKQGGRNRVVLAAE